MPDQPVPGSRENPLPIPDAILNGQSAWRGTMFERGLFLNVDDHLWYQYPEPYPLSWAETIKRFATEWEKSSHD